MVREGWAMVACPSPMQEERAIMAQVKGKLPYATAMKLRGSGLMTEEQMIKGLHSGDIAPKAVTRDYGVDQPYYLEIQGYVDKCNEETQLFKFSVTSRSKVAVDVGDEGNVGTDPAD